jgi:uncharacterized protein YfaS (alpha-2-macroglobulin family)
MKKHISIILAALIIVAGIVFAQKANKITIEKRWTTVEELAEKQLPESALKEVEVILNQAQEEKNSSEIIKAFVYKMRFTLEKEPDRAAELIKEFEAFCAKTTDASEKALLLSMTAELYAQHYQNDRWNIGRRTNVQGYVPQDMNEWTGNIYFEKVTGLLDASLQNVAQLQQTDALKFATLLEKGDDSRTLQPTLFDFLAYRKIQILQSISGSTDVENPLDDKKYFSPAGEFIQLQPDAAYEKSIENKIISTYKQLLAFHLTDKNPDALIYADLQRLKYVSSKGSDQETYLNALQILEEKYAMQPSVVEVISEKAQYFRNKTAADKTALKKAYDLCADGIKRFSDYRRIDLLKNIQAEISHKQLFINYKSTSLPTSEYKIKLHFANLEEVELRLYKLDVSAVDYFVFQQNNRRDNSLHPSAKLTETRKIRLKKDEYFGLKDTLISIQTGSFGIYEFTFSEANQKNEEQIAYGGFTVTALSYMMRKTEENKTGVYVLDRKTGQPLPNTIVKTRNINWTGKGYESQPLANNKTDKTGFCNIASKNDYSNHAYFLERGDDKYFCNQSYQYFNNYKVTEIERPQLTILTDRSLYRPGQTVYFKGISYFSSKNRVEVNKNAEYEITLYDANYQKVSSKKFKTNEFGSFSGEFVLPQGGLNGDFTLSSGNFSQSIWVEEYKRPTFEVKIPKPESEIRFGEKMTIKGNVKAFAGYDMANAKVKYRVMRKAHYYCWWIREFEKELTTGSLTSDANGNFEFSFVPEKPNNAEANWRGNIYTYTVITDVTNPNGETQQGETSFSVGDKALFVIANIPHKVDKNSLTGFDVHTETINGEKVSTIIDYSLYRLEDPTDFSENNRDFDSLKVKSKMLEAQHKTSDKKLTIDMKKWESGLYRLTLTTKDKFGNEVKNIHNFVLFGTNDKRPAVKSYVWFSAENTECAPGEKALIRFGTSTRNTKVLFELMQGNKVIESKWVKFDNQIKTFKIPFKTTYGEGVNVQFSFMKDEKLFTRQITLTKKKTEKKLSPKFAVFRNKLLPGANETWTVSIPGTENNAAELLASMYDASLDMLRPHSWFFNPAYNQSVSNSPLWQTAYDSNKYSNATSPVTQTGVYQYKLDRLNWFGLSLAQRYYNGPIRIRGTKTAVVANEMPAMDMSVAEALQGKVGGVATESVSPPPPPEMSEDIFFQTTGSVQEFKEKIVQPRTNFSETAFFYPQLKTDVQGNVTFSFTAPESLTRWNVKLLAHTANLYFGSFDTTAVTQKDLMVQINLPRFVRRSDKLILSANVVNLTDKEINATVTFDLIDPTIDKVIVLKDNKKRTVDLKANETKVVEWEITEFENLELVVCKVIAVAGNFSDGEQKYLPVLPDNVLVTESMPMTIRGGQTRTFNFRSLAENLSGVDTRNLTVEFSANPAWYAVQALPTLSQPDADNALSLFTAYYANSLAGFIANSNPKIARVFDQWKNAKGSREALLSNLEKNQELKNMLLEETPWVMAAKDESEQKRQIALLFDLNMQKNQAQQYLDKLLNIQRPDGGFGWYEGMPSSRYITQEILLNYARLNRMTKQGWADDKIQTAISKALRYLDLEVSRDFAELKKYNKDYQKQNCISNIQLFYLHMRSEYPEMKLAEEANDAMEFYTTQAEKYWTSFTLYGKAMMAVVAQRNSKSEIVTQIMKSLRENALKTDEFGMYWARNTSGYFWNERPVAVQAAIIEAFTETGANTAEIDELKIWLLKQKQTQRWDSPMTSVNAVYALLLQGSDWLSGNSGVSISLGNKLLKPETTEAGTGYFKQSIPLNEIQPEMAKITITNIGNTVSGSTSNGSSIGWGAAYWQYYQDIDKVRGQSGALKISKKLFVKQGTSMIPIEQTTLTKGDKVITRLVITTDRNLEFVALKDLRASCFEPVNQLSGCAWKENVCYYQTTKDASTQFFFSYLPKGTYVFEYELWVNNSGSFTSGIATLQCQYAPEFVSHTGGERITVE